MTSHDRFLACMRFKPADRTPLWELGPWHSTLRRWQRESSEVGEEAPQYAECDAREGTNVDLWMRPRFKYEILSDDGRYVIRRTERGVITRGLSSPDEMSMPEHLEYPVKSAEDWKALKKNFNPNDPARFLETWSADCERWKKTHPALLFVGSRTPSLFGFVRELMGPEKTLYAFSDEPELVHDMMETITQVILGVLPKILAEAPVTALFLWEDMCYKSGPLISPAMFREFMSPRYRRITDLARKHGVDVTFVDSDGDVSKLIPLWIESGVNGVYPMEVTAGMDVVALRRQYGRDLLIAGGIDKRTLARDKRAIDAELERKLPLAEQGGYIPHLDHGVPHDVSYENFRHYWKRKKEILGIAKTA